MGELLIAAAVPAFRSKPPRWFRKNKKRIRRMGREQSFWERNTLLLSKEWGGGMRALTEKLVTLGYAVAPWPEKKRRIYYPWRHRYHRSNQRESSLPR